MAHSDEWTYDPHYPDDEQPDEVIEAFEHDQVDVLVGRVYAYLCRMARADGYVRLEMHEGFNWIARAAVDAETAQLFRREHELTNEDDETWILFRIREDVEQALIELHDRGHIEWVIRNGWPWLMVPNAATDSLAMGLEGKRYVERASRLAELRRMPYQDYLRSPEWKARREIHLTHAGERCQVCNAASSLHVHHRTYERRGNERFSDLIVLCATCHRHFHDGLGLARDAT